MKKLFLILLLIIPISVNALSINSEDANSSAILFGDNVESSNKIEGINMMFGNVAKHNGESDYLISIANNIEINGKVNNDSFILGNVVKFNETSTIERDLLIGASEVELNGTVKRDVTIYASIVTIKGDVENVNIKANQIIIEDANINDLSYNEDAIIEINNSQVNTTNLTEKITQTVTIQEQIINFIYSLGGILVIFLAMYLLVPNLFKRIENNNENITILNGFSLFGFGTLSLILIPITFILLLTLIFCLPLAILLLVLYIIAICLSSIFTGYLLGYLIWKYLIKKEHNSLLIGLIGISILNLLGIIPVIGTLISVISVMIGMGIILQQFKRN